MPVPSYSDDNLTLAESIVLLRHSEDPRGQVTDAMNSVADRAFEQHDVVHIIFGLGTSLQDEIAAHVWMIFATDAKLSEMHRAVANAEHGNVLSGIGHLRLLGAWFVSLPRILAIIAKTTRMKKKIAFDELTRLKSMHLGAIRAEYGIII